MEIKKKELSSVIVLVTAATSNNHEIAYQSPKLLLRLLSVCLSTAIINYPRWLT